MNPSGYEDFPELAELYDNVTFYNNRDDAAFYADLCSQGQGPLKSCGPRKPDQSR